MKHIALLLTALSVLPVGVTAQTLAARLSRPIEYWNPEWSPDGRTLIFESTLAGNSSIYAINADGTGLRRLTTDTAESYQARWSPDGRRIVFSSERDGGTQIYTMNADGSGAVQLTSFPGGGYYQSSFSPDGNWIAFQGRPDNRETRDRVWAMRSDGSQLRLLSDTTKGAEGPEWLADSRTLRFHQVPYPKRYWSEMVEADMTGAKSAARDLVVRVDGSGLAPAPASRKSNRPAEVPNDAVATRDARRFAYTKTVDGFAALYVYDVATKRERMLTGGAGAGPLGYLRTTTLPMRSDTFDSFTSPRAGGALVRGSGVFYVRSIRQIGQKRFELASTWYDSANNMTARQTVRTARGSLATDLENVRSNTDSASLLITGDRVTGWAVPAGSPMRLYDAPNNGERYAGDVVSMAIANSKPAIGSVFVATGHSLYGSNAAEITVDSIRVLRSDTLIDRETATPVLVLERKSGVQSWVDERTGAILLARGNAGPQQYWWHIPTRRAVSHAVLTDRQTAEAGAFAVGIAYFRQCGSHFYRTFTATWSRSMRCWPTLGRRVPSSTG